MDASSAEQGQAESEWDAVVRAGVEAQRLVPGAIAVGGTASALYAHHRVSLDTDHLVADLTSRFEEVRATLEAAPEWKTARVVPPKMILGSIEGIEIGIRQMIRKLPVETCKVTTRFGQLVVPTLDELLGMKAYLAYSRRATRDFIDFAALTSCLSDSDVLASLMRSDERYGELQSDSVSLEIAKALSEPLPFDLDTIDLRVYKGIKPPWDEWPHVESVCRRLGLQFAEALISRDRP